MSETINSPQNSRIKDAVKLRDRRARSKQGRTIIDGAREIRRAIDGGVELVELFVCRELLSQAAVETVEHADPTGNNTFEVSARAFEKLQFGERNEGVIAVVKLPTGDLHDWSPPENALVVVVEGVEKPGNLGAIVRSADGAGASGVIVADRATDLFNPNTIRASLGLVFLNPVFSVSTNEAIRWLVDRQMQIITTVVGASRSCFDVDYTCSTAIVLGNEAKGLSNDWRGDQTIGVHVPMAGHGDSLNVSVTGGILLYEAHRQRMKSA